MMYEAEQAAAMEAVVQACRLCRSVRKALVSEDTMTKRDRSPVTVADFGSQALVNTIVHAAFPDDSIMAEEDAAELRSDGGIAVCEQVVRHVAELRPDLSGSQILDAIDLGTSAGGPDGRCWVLDPIDGTKGFLRGDQYAIALALLENGRPVLGVLGCPNLPMDPPVADADGGSLFVASAGAGAFARSLSGEPAVPVRVSELDDPAGASFCESVESGHSAHDDAARVAQQLSVSRPPYRIDSQCKYAAVARGNASIYLRLPTRADYEEKLWDHAAGWIVVTEAGGRVTDISGRPLDFSLGRTLRDNKGIVATNGKFHQEVIDAIQAVLG